MRSAIIYQGPSLIDGSPIFVVATLSGANRKTGRFVQTYIMRSDMSPLAASKSGADSAICGDCPHRGTPTSDPKRKQAERRSCYVNLGQGPTIVWKAFAKGVYADVSGHEAIAALGRDHMVRLGTYGDPGAVPSYIWESLISEAESWTAYTHQSNWRPDLAMQSADTLEDAQSAWGQGHRTFRVVSAVSELVSGREVLCPASKEAGARVQCVACKLCMGSSKRGKSVAIVDHGPLARRKKAVAA